MIGTPSIVNVIPKGTALARCLLNKKAVCSHLDQVLVKQEIHNNASLDLHLILKEEKGEKKRGGGPAQTVEQTQKLL